MASTDPIPPRLDDVRDVLRLVLMLLADSTGLDVALGALRAGAGECDDELDVVPKPAWRAANRFVLDALIDAVCEDFAADLDI
jgi:hypothetical protein